MQKAVRCDRGGEMAFRFDERHHAFRLLIPTFAQRGQEERGFGRGDINVNIRRKIPTSTFQTMPKWFFSRQLLLRDWRNPHSPMLKIKKSSLPRVFFSSSLANA